MAFVGFLDPSGIWKKIGRWQGLITQKKWPTFKPLDNFLVDYLGKTKFKSQVFARCMYPFIFLSVSALNITCFEGLKSDTVDGRNPAPPGMYKTL